jgi:mono/diheme cytochrome c family protein
MRLPSSSTRKPALLLLPAAMAFLLPGWVTAQDVGRGERLAKTWCANCHVVEKTPSAAIANGLPTFASLSNLPGQSADRLRAAMNPQHSRMPDLQLSKQQQDDLVGYIFFPRTR